MLSIYSVLLSLSISTVLAAFVLPRIRLTAFHNKNRFGVVNEGGNTVSRVSYIGGTGFFPVILISIGLSVIFDFRMKSGLLPESPMEQLVRMLQLVSGMSALYLVGLKDDFYGCTIKLRLLVLFFAAVLFPISGVWINNLYGIFGIYELPFWIGMPFTVALVMYLTTTISLTDGIYGLASGQCLVSLLFVLIFSVMGGSYMTAIVSCAGLGVVLCFFVSRMVRLEKRASFMGSSGSLPLGYLICFVILFLYKYKEWFGLSDGVSLAAFCTMLMPAADMLRVLKSRFVDRRSLTTPDRNMLNHKLTRAGMGPRMVLLVIMLVNLFFIIASGILLNKHVNITFIFVADVIIFVACQWIINFFIFRNERLTASSQWEKTYGKDNWSDEEYENALDEMDLQKAAETILYDKEAPKQKILMPTPAMEEIPFIPDGMNAFERNVKRIVDCIVASGCLVVFSPLFVLSYILIKLDDGGPAIFKQERIGRFGRPFYIYKFRSMRLDAEKKGPQLSHSGGDEDDRLTKVGRFLRAHHLDELPQIWNVFCGDMAFIGYRPERQFFISQITEHDPRYHMLYQIRPGVTSYATLYNGYTDTMEKMLTRLELDLYYLKHRSWWFDAKILFLTFWHIVGGKKF